MINTKHIFYFLIIMAGSLLASQESLQNYLETAAHNNPGLKSRFYQYQAALEKVPQVGALPDPQISFGYFIQPVETRNGPQEARFSISQLFPWFGLLNSRENVAAYSAKAKYENFLDAKAKLFYEVKSAYFNLYVVNKAIGLTRDNIKILESFERLNRVKMETGNASAVDGLRIDMQLAELENQLEALNESKTVRLVEFQNLVNDTSVVEIDIPDSLWEDGLAENKSALLDSIKNRNHMLTALDLKSTALDYQLKAAKKSGKPSFNIGVDYIVIGETDNSMVSADVNGQDAIMFPKIGMTLPLYRKKYKAMANEAELLQKATVEQKRDRENTLETLFEKKYNEYIDAERRIGLNNTQVYKAEQALRLLETDYSAGRARFDDLLQMEKTALKYNLEREKARAEKQIARAFILYLMGQ